MLQGKTAVVTGAAKGIGKATALAFAKEGCNIVLNYHSSLDDETVQEIEACGVTCMPVQGDVSDFAFAADMMKKVKKELGSVDILVNNAGITKDMLLMRMTEEQFDSVIQTNLKGTFNMIRHASSIMLKQRSGAIIKCLNSCSQCIHSIWVISLYILLTHIQFRIKVFYFSTNLNLKIRRIELLNQINATFAIF